VAKPIIEPISAATLPQFAAFLSANMGNRRRSEDWIAGLQTDWHGDRPNHGFLLREEQTIVGGIGAFYAQRRIRGQTEKFCNITSWCVLDSHRKWSMPLAMAVIKQPGYHFTDFSPTQVVGGVLRFLKFKPLDEAVAVIANALAVPLGGKIVATPAGIARGLTGDARQIWQDHAQFGWLRHVLVGQPGHWCHVIYKRDRFKGLPSARIVYRSDADLLASYLPRLAWHFLGAGMVTTQIERRFLRDLPRFSRLRTGFNPKLHLSATLRDEDIDYLYSESVALDL